jgi:hypothetical protein
MTLQQVIAQCQKTGELSVDQLKKLEAVAPIEVHETDETIAAPAAQTEDNGEVF